ncbi:MAG TPA: hypothetical protein VMR31_18580 [Myxococcota bacterium]|nr:hypothetical protein [Myxococcota bacterium]
MASSHSDTPAWLFSFVDLAFLILLAMTQLGSPDSAKSIDLGEIVVPKIGSDAGAQPMAATYQGAQLRVYPPGDGQQPFELVTPNGAPVRVTKEALRPGLTRLRSAGLERPLLAPHADSRSEDLLYAVGLIEDIWPSNRRATIERVSDPQ